MDKAMNNFISFHLHATVDPTFSKEELSLLPSLEREVTEAVQLPQEKQRVCHQTSSAR